MGWLFTHGSTLKSQIRHLSEGWERQLPDGTNVETTCLAHCYRGGSFSGNLWSVWERTFVRDGQETQPAERWITLCLLNYQTGYGWGYKDMEEASGPYFYSCPLKYLGKRAPGPFLKRRLSCRGNEAFSNPNRSAEDGTASR
ncbi:MAG TPA: hypothetical protein VGG64_04540 [Pirellulales bacterium]|jgi:hypothetical protein